MAFTEYIANVRGWIDRFERDIDGLAIGYRQVRRQVDTEIKRDMKKWLGGVETLPRSRENAFKMIANTNSAKPAFGIVDSGMRKLDVFFADKSLLRPAVGAGAPAKAVLSAQKNFYRSQAIMRREVGLALDDLNLRHPSQTEDIRVMQQMLSDRESEIEGVKFRDGRQLKESMQRAITAEEPVATAMQTVSNWSINKGFFDSATASHDRGLVRNVMARAGLASAAAGVTGYADENSQKWIVMPKEDGFSKRVDDNLAYNILTTGALASFYKGINKDRKQSSDWKELGMGFNTNEYYIPIFKDEEEEAEEWANTALIGLAALWATRKKKEKDAEASNK